MELRMKESHIEGLANHNGPESSTLIRKDAREAVTGESTGRVLSREKGISRVPTLSTYAEGNTDMREKERRGVHNPVMDGYRQSDRPILPAKPLNKAPNDIGAAEAVEGRGLAEGNAAQQNTSRTQCRPKDVPNALDRIRQAAIRNKEEKFTALLHHITLERLRSAFYGIKKNAAAGVDGVTWGWYEEDLEGNLQDLHSRVQRGAYRAKPSRRGYIPKPDGRQRPLGIAALEDKVVQRATAEVLNAIYEADFLGYSYGFRPGRQAHEALDALAVGIPRKKVSWVLDADIRGYFDSINHEWLMKFIERRISDGRILRLIKKWLKAGVVEDGRYATTDEGTPQGE